MASPIRPAVHRVPNAVLRPDIFISGVVRPATWEVKRDSVGCTHPSATPRIEESGSFVSSVKPSANTILNYELSHPAQLLLLQLPWDSRRVVQSGYRHCLDRGGPPC